ncbi:hypothetical protein B0T17DRAFT_222043 [Bombardia bombarda]|uniref:Uncharacterized protein n=1 Tax=Bombardia bombarda TaxID=252184 RepID=A0AA39XAR6_9PEZI|nr:hypothetical protein B0T17DRAFT_222043 [Bombardia bombarda]
MHNLQDLPSPTILLRNKTNRHNELDGLVVPPLQAPTNPSFTFYLLPATQGKDGEQHEIPYCRSCGRVISSRRADATKTAATPAKYCSTRCRSQKPRNIDREIENAFVKFLTGEEAVPVVKSVKKIKSDARILVPCDVVEEYVFGDRSDPAKVFGRKKNRASRVLRDVDEDVHQSNSGTRGEVVEDVVDDDDLDLDGHDKRAVIDGDVLARMSVRSGTRIRPPQTVSEVNGSVGGEKGWAERSEETEEMREKREDGKRRAHEKEMVRCAARRGVVFGFGVGGDETRKCEAVMQGKVVEPSFAKGDWVVRWRE